MDDTLIFFSVSYRFPKHTVFADKTLKGTFGLLCLVALLSWFFPLGPRKQNLSWEKPSQQ